MISFKCKYESDNDTEFWDGCIKRLDNYGNYYEIFIESRSSIMVMFGKTTRGLFACMPDYEVSCHLVDLRDYFWNSEKLIKILGHADGITVATALFQLNKQSNLF